MKIIIYVYASFYGFLIIREEKIFKLFIQIHIGYAGGVMNIGVEIGSDELSSNTSLVGCIHIHTDTHGKCINQ